MNGKNKEAKLAKRYFDEWASDYDAAFGEDIAFEGDAEEHPLQKLINRLFRSKTFEIREAHLAKLIDNLQVRRKNVLDIGCGSGQLALRLASKGAKVTGYDISPAMIRLCKAKAKKLNLKAKFEVFDLVAEKIPKADIIFNIAVIEYYQDFEPILEKMLASTGETLILTDARYIWWRAILRKVLGSIKNFPVYYHNPEKVKEVAKKSGFSLKKEYILHSFRTFVFIRTS